MRKQAGLSLVELMVSITLGLILVGGVVQMLVGTKLAFNSQKATSRVQESGRLAVEFMAKDIRMAGYSGCSTRSELTGMKIDSTLDSTDVEYDFLTGLRGYSITSVSDASYTLLDGMGITPNVGTDVIELSGATGSGIVVKKNNSSSTLFASLSSEVTNGCGTTNSFDGLCVEDILIVTDCVQARVFHATGINNSSGEIHITHAASGTPGNDPTSWGGASSPDPVFGPGAEIIKMEKKFYYIKNNAAGEPSLYLWTNGVDTELIEGVEDMAITYGRDTGTDNIPDAYESASTVSAITPSTSGWPKVLSVRVELLVRTPETVLKEDQSIFFPTTATTATKYTDGRLRQVFTTTVGIRSRLQ